MSRKMVFVTCAGLFLLFVPLTVLGQNPVSSAMDVPADSRCAACGMRCVIASPFTAQALAGEERLFFCDIGDMLHEQRRRGGGLQAFVRDLESNEWLPARQAWYVKDEARWNTPMAWGIAAFRERAQAERHGEAMDFEKALELVE